MSNKEVINFIRAPANLARLGTVVLGTFVMGFGLHSHFESIWMKTTVGVGLYQRCEVVILKEAYKSQGAPCPSISLEQYYVAVVIISFVLSVIGLTAMFLVDLSKFKIIDIGFHGVSSLLLMIAGVVYIISAELVQAHFEKTTGAAIVDRMELHRGEKLLAGALTILQGGLYGVTAFLIYRRIRQ